MFLYDENGKPTKVMLFDLQLVGEACPSLDFAKLFFTSLSPELRQRHKEDFLQIYYDSFMNICNLLKCEPFPGFTLETLSRRYRRLEIYGFILSMALLSLVKSQPPPADGHAHPEPKDIIEIFKMVTKGNMNNKVLMDWLCDTAAELYESGVF